MQNDKIIAAIAAYLEKETRDVDSGENRITLDFGVKNPGYYTHARFCKEFAAEIAAAIAPCFDMLQNACEEVVKGYEGDGLENISTRDKVFYRLCKEALEPIIVCPDCNGSGGVEIGEYEYSVCPCVNQSIAPEE